MSLATARAYLNIAQVDLGRMFAKAGLRSSTSNSRAASGKITGLQLGYEARCAQPHAFDVMLGSQLGVGAYRALVEERLNGVMVSVVWSARAEVTCISRNWSNPETLVTVVRYVESGIRFPQPGPVPRNLRRSRRAGVDVTWDGSPEPTTAGSSHSRIRENSDVGPRMLNCHQFSYDSPGAEPRQEEIAFGKSSATGNRSA